MPNAKAKSASSILLHEAQERSAACAANWLGALGAEPGALGAEPADIFVCLPELPHSFVTVNIFEN